jgi:cytochrome c556
VKAIWGISLGALAAAAMIGSAVVAQEKATGVVAYRQSVMKANGAHMGALQVALTDQKQLLKNAAYHAEAIKEAVEYVGEAFPAGSTQASNALPAVWENSAGFAAAAKKAEELAEALAQALESGDAAASLAAFQALGKDGCGGCHTTFRKKPA